jgi:Co/Zn/Cd efflux system component
VLLDAEDYHEVKRDIRAAIEAGPDERITDLHVWRVGPRSLACIVSLVTHEPGPAAAYKDRLAHIAGLDHVTVEVNHCTPEQCPATREWG